LYRVLYTIMSPLVPAIRAIFPNAVTTTERVGRAMIAVAQRGYAKPVLEPPDINHMALSAGAP
jgi:hypothetical protein